MAIPYNATDKDLEYLLARVNGVFFTGGDIDLYNKETGEPHPYTVTAKKILTYTKHLNDNGVHFPIVGVC